MPTRDQVGTSTFADSRNHRTAGAGTSPTHTARLGPALRRFAQPQPSRTTLRRCTGGGGLRLVGASTLPTHTTLLGPALCRLTQPPAGRDQHFADSRYLDHTPLPATLWRLARQRGPGGAHHFGETHAARDPYNRRRGRPTGRPTGRLTTAPAPSSRFWPTRPATPTHHTHTRTGPADPSRWTDPSRRRYRAGCTRQCSNFRASVVEAAGVPPTSSPTTTFTTKSAPAFKSSMELRGTTTRW
jgi:hypothetical protein